jgi:hypothetical protein
VSKQIKKKKTEVDDEPEMTQAISEVTDGKIIHKLIGWRGSNAVPMCGANATLATQLWAAVNCPACKVQRQKQALAETKIRPR